MPSAGMPSARCSSSSRSGGLFSWARAGGVVLVGAGQRGGPLAHRVGEQQLAAAGRVQLVDGGDGALVGDGERAQLADLVAPELDAHGVLGGGREDVDDPAAHGELAARRDHLDPRVGQLDEPHQQGVEVVGVADAQRHRLEPAQAGGDRLDEAARGGDDQARRVVGGEAAEHREPAADGVRARREALVRQGLPAGQHGDGCAIDQIRGGGAQVLGLAVGGGDGEHGATASVSAVAVRPGRRRARRPGTAAVPRGPRRPAPGRRWRAGRGMRRRGRRVRGRRSRADRKAWPRFPLQQVSAQQSRPLPGTDGGLRPGYARRFPRESARSPARVGTFAGASRHVRRRESARSRRESAFTGRKHAEQARQHRRPSLSATHEQVRRV